MLTPSSQPYSSLPGFARSFAPGRLTLGLFYPLEAYQGDAPSMEDHVERAQEAEAAGFASLFIRDVPLRDPSFGDLGQIFDPFVFLGYLAARTTRIALGTGGIVVPLRNPLHLAKAAASVDRLSRGRLLLGVASGDRPVEFPAFGVDPERRGEILREHLEVIRAVQRTSFEPQRWAGGRLEGADLVPKPLAREVPLLITGNSRQSVEWIAAHAHGWINYPRPIAQQALLIETYRTMVAAACGEVFKPFVQSLFIDLAHDPDAAPKPIHLGFSLGRHHLLDMLERLQGIGVNQVILSLKYSRRPAQAVIAELERHVVPHFAALTP